MRDKRIITRVALAMAIGVAALCGCSRTSRMERELIEKALSESTAYIDRVDGKQLDAFRSRYSDRVLLVSYWSTKNASSPRLLARSVALAEHFRERDFNLVTVCIDDPNQNERIAGFLDASGASMTNIQNFVSKYGATEVALRDFTLPDDFLLFYRLYDREGELVLDSDQATADQLESKIEELLATNLELTTLLKKSRELLEVESPKPSFEPRPLFDDETDDEEEW